MKYLSNTKIENSRVVVRVDYNVKADSDGVLRHDERIRASLPTIKYLLEGKNQVILVSHLGRPKGIDKTLSLEKIKNHLEKLLDRKIKFIQNRDFRKWRDEIDPKDEIIMVENIRYWGGEEKNNIEFTKSLAKLGDIFVQDAFSVCHRSSASVVGVTKFLPSLAGLTLECELESINLVVKKTTHPFVVVLGGAKISDKLPLIDSLLEKADTFLLGGAIANTFLSAIGVEIDDSYYEKDMKEVCIEIFQKAKKLRKNIILPIDVLNNKGLNISVNSTNRTGTIVDIGVATTELFVSFLENANSILWNGPMGIAENTESRVGTNKIFKAIYQNKKANVVVGGGDTIKFVPVRPDTAHYHLSTGGGALLEYIASDKLVGLEALR